MRVITKAAALALVLALPGAAHAQPVTAPAGELAVDLDQALRMSLDLSPQVRRSGAEVAFREGRLREVRGLFDTRLRLRSTFGYVETALDPNSLQQENQRRRGLFTVANVFSQLHEDILGNIARGIDEVPICPPGFSSIRLTDRSEIDLGLNEPVCIPVGLGNDTPEGLVSRALQNLFNPPGHVDVAAIDRQLRSILGLVPDERAADLEQLGLEQVARSERLASLIGEQTALSLERVGLIPETEFRKTLAFEVHLDKALRNGSFVGLEAIFSGQELNYRGKPLDPAFGGKGLENEFRTGFFATVNQPLGKHRGARSAQAAERAAVALLEAARLRYAQSFSERTLATVRAHVGVLAAQEQLTLIEQSVTSQQTIFEGMQQLVQAGERSRSDLTRSQTGLADAQTNVFGARIGVLAARNELARVIGIDSGKGIGPGVRGTFPTTLIELPEVAVLARRAAVARLDLQALTQEEEAARIIFEAARADLRKRVDLSLRVGMASDYRSPFFRVERDEFRTDPDEAPEDPVNYYSFRGFGRSLSNKYLPDIRLQVTFDIPFGNNAAKGRMERSLQAYRQSQLRTTDLARVIQQNVTQIGAAVRAARTEVEERRKAVAQHEATWKAALELRKAGELSLIDTLITEQDLTAARLALVRAEQGYTEALARLRFESGDLSRFENGRPAGSDLSGLLGPSS
jgi:outer membrane protein TolC